MLEIVRGIFLSFIEVPIFFVSTIISMLIIIFTQFVKNKKIRKYLYISSFLIIPILNGIFDYMEYSSMFNCQGNELATFFMIVISDFILLFTPIYIFYLLIRFIKKIFKFVYKTLHKKRNEKRK